MRNATMNGTVYRIISLILLSFGRKKHSSLLGVLQCGYTVQHYKDSHEFLRHLSPLTIHGRDGGRYSLLLLLVLDLELSLR